MRTQPLSRDILSGGVRSNDGLTLYGRYGDVFAILCAIVPLAVLIVAAVRRRV